METPSPQAAAGRGARTWLIAATLMAVAALWLAVGRVQACGDRHGAAAPSGRSARISPAAMARALGLAVDGEPPAMGGARGVLGIGALRLEGLVVDEGGVPVQGAVVAVGERRVSTEDDGWFAFDGVAAGTYVVTARVEDVGSAGGVGRVAVGRTIYRLGRETEPAIIAVRAGVTVRVSVALQGAPVAGAEVELRNDWRATATTSAEGWAVFAGVLPGPATIAAVAPNVARAMREVHVTRDGLTVALHVLASQWLVGAVTDERGAPIEGAALSVVTPQLTIEDDEILAYSDAQGQFTLPVVAGDVVRVAATHPRFLRAISAPVVATAANGAAGAAPSLQLIMRAGAELRGRAVDASGAPVVGATVTLFEEADDEASARARQASTGADGGFGFAAVARVAVSLRAETEGARSEIWSAPAVPQEAVELTLRGDARLRGRVVDRGGALIGGARVVAYREDSFDLQYGNVLAGVADADGAFVLGGADAADYVVVATRADAELDVRDAAAMPHAVRARPGGEPLVLVVDDAAVVTGTVVGGAAQARYTVQLGGISVTALPGVAFSIAGVTPGEYGVQVRDRGEVVAFVPEVRVAAPGTPLGEIRLAPVRTIRGVVRDAQGLPVRGALISAGNGAWLDDAPMARLVNSDSVAQAWSAADGGFQVEARDFGDLAVRADTAAARSMAVAIQGAAGMAGLADTPLVLTLMANATILGRVVGGDGQARARQIVAIGADGSSHRTYSGSDGRFALTVYPAGRFTIYLGDGDGPDQAPIAVVQARPGEPSFVELREP